MPNNTLEYIQNDMNIFFRIEDYWTLHVRILFILKLSLLTLLNYMFGMHFVYWNPESRK